MPDFTSALYLGLRHATPYLRPWQALTEGRPAALGESAEATTVARRLARLAGMPRALLYPSTLHLFLDLFDTLDQRSIALLWDAGLYPVPRWSIERAAGLGIPSYRFDQHRPTTLERALARCPPGRTPVLVTTGFCPGCGALAPLRTLLRQAEAANGFLVVDDTQMFGLLGATSAGAPLGRGGGGTARFLGLSSAHLLIGASLAKAFGAPIAFLAGPAAQVADAARHGPTRWHASPVSAAGVASAAHALDVNTTRGDVLRARLQALSSRFAAGLARQGLAAAGPPLPIQSTIALPRASAEALHRAVQRSGVRCLLQHARCRGGAILTFLLTAAHDDAEVDEAVAAVEEAWSVIASTRGTAIAAACGEKGRA